jgi:uncharacterized protein
MGRFELRKSTDGQFFFNLKSDNGQVILTSERYKQRDSAVNGIESVKKNAPNETRFERKTSAANKPMFVLKAANHEVIGVSEQYATEQGRDFGITAVRQHAPAAPIEDHTNKSA